jgi:hypothetical protein
MADNLDPGTGTELSQLERAIDTALFWPFDLGARAAEQLPGLADRVRDQLVFARFIGRLAVQQGNVEIRRRISSAAEPATSAAEPATSADLSDREHDHPTEPGLDTSPIGKIDVVDLALPDYDQLPAAHIIDKLAGLTRSERDLIESYEAATRGRRTVLGKLERLQEQ